MTLIKSKINSLAWLKSAIYISVVGGLILFSKPASARFTSDTETLGTYVLVQDFPSVPPPPLIEGANWLGQANVTPRSEGNNLNNHFLAISGFFQHKPMPSHSHKDPSGVFTFNLSLKASDLKDPNGNTVTRTITDLLHHENHSDSFKATLQAIIDSPNPSEHHIVQWTFNLEGRHRSEPVPEPTTIFGSALALGVGGWLKRKKSSQHNKIMP